MYGPLELLQEPLLTGSCPYPHKNEPGLQKLRPISPPLCPQDTLDKFSGSYYDFNDMKPGLMDRSMKGYWDYDGHMGRVKAQEYSVILDRFLGGLKTGETNPDEYFSNAP